MFDDVTMQHPIARIVGNECDLSGLARQHEERIGVVLGSVLFVGAEQFERVAVNVDGMRKR